MKKITTLLLSVFILNACSDTREAPVERVDVPRLSEKPFQKPKWSEILDPLADRGISACDTLQSLSINKDMDLRRYSLFERFETTEDGLNAKINVANSPFTLFYLGESLRIPGRKEFYLQAKAQYEAGELSWPKWQLVNAAYHTNDWAFDKVRFSAINDLILEGFPGIYGEASPVDSSLFAALAKKSLLFGGASGGDFDFSVLTANTPLFSGSSWAEELENTRTSLSSLITAYYSSDSKDRNCATIVSQRLFAQLLAIKGFMGPEYIESSVPKIKKLSGERPNFVKVPFFGAYVGSNGPVVLSADDIANYDPAVEKLSLVSPKTKLGMASFSATLSERLDFFRNMIQIFRFTSPAEKWVTNKDAYLLGDITAANTKILPLEANSLALGFTVMELKNLAADSLVFINGEGKAKQANEDTAGALLGTLSGKNLKISLKEVARFSDAVIFMDRALSAFSKKTVAEINEINPNYDLASLASLVGTEMLSADQLPAGFDQSATLIGQLRALQFPIAQMLVKLTKGKACLSEINYNIYSAEIDVLGLCSEAEKAMGKKALNNLAIHTDSAALYQE